MTNDKAMEILRKAIDYSCQDHNKMSHAIQHMAEIKGWSREEAAVKFVEFCLLEVVEWKSKNSGYTLIEANDASNVALFVDREVGNIINKHLKTK
jgi:hypothetical protein